MTATQPGQWRHRATGGLRRAIALLMSVTLIAGSLVCPAPAAAHDEHSDGDHSSAVGHPHEHDHGTGSGRSHDNSDLCCDILGHVAAAVGSPGDPQKQLSAPDHAPVAVIAPLPVVCTVFDEAVSLIRHGPAPPPQPWPEFSKIRSHAPPADHV